MQIEFSVEDALKRQESIFVSDECYTEEVVLQTEDTEHQDENDDDVYDLEVAIEAGFT